MADTTPLTAPRDLWLLVAGAALVDEGVRARLKEFRAHAPDSTWRAFLDALAEGDGKAVWGYLGRLADVRREGEEAAIDAVLRRTREVAYDRQILRVASAISEAAAEGDAKKLKAMFDQISTLTEKRNG